MQIQYINNLRALACILVIMTHVAMPALDPSFGIFMVFFSLMSSPSSELFVTMSSSLLAPTKLSMFEFYKKRFSKLLGPFLFWSIVTVGIAYAKGAISLETALQRILFIPIQPAGEIYWFVYVICGLYFIIPILSPFLINASKKQLQFLLLLWAITLSLPYINILYQKPIYSINGNYYFVLNYLGGFIGFMLLGVYFRQYPILCKHKLQALCWSLLMFLLGTAPILYGYIYNKEILIWLNDNLSLTSAVFVAGLFILAQNIDLPNYIASIVNVIAKYSFGIYLIHFIVARDVIWPIMSHYRLSHPLIETPFLTMLTLLMCLGIVKIISWLPKSKYIIGI